MRVAAIAALAALVAWQAPAHAQEGPQKAPVEPPLSAIVVHFFPGYAPVSLGDLDPAIAELTVTAAVYDDTDRSPTMIRADFDGNGFTDYAVLIKKSSEDGTDEIFTILMAYGGGRYAKAMESFFGSLSSDIYLGYLPAGATVGADPGNIQASAAVVLPGPAVTLTVQGQTPDAFYWDKEARRFANLPATQ